MSKYITVVRHARQTQTASKTLNMYTSEQICAAAKHTIGLP